MAVDSRDKRMSMIGIANGRFSPHVMPNPAGSDFNLNTERAHMAYMYAGIAPESGKPTMTYWKGVPHMRVGPQFGGRSW